MISGVWCSRINNDNDRTILINFVKFQKFQRSNVASSNQPYEEVCTDAENKEYRKCGNKCVLSCRDTWSSSNFSALNENCSEDICIEGCFCKDEFVRDHDKCILAKECPISDSKAFQLSKLQALQSIFTSLGNDDGKISVSNRSGKGGKSANNNNNNNPINNYFQIPGKNYLNKSNNNAYFYMVANMFIYFSKSVTILVSITILSRYIVI